MASSPIIELTRVGKEYAKHESSLHRTLSSRLRGHEASETIWALRDITLTIARGESVGIIGLNGSGKTTLLRVIAGVTRPTTGTVSVQGSVHSMIEVGSGLHPELTGGENITLLGTILGMQRKDIRTRYMDILTFADLTEFEQMPLKRYSSGMRARLAFAVSIYTNPEILLIDETIEVGDWPFRKKSIAALQHLRERGVTIVAASHSREMLSQLCGRVLWLNKGQCRTIGDPSSVLSAYHAA